MAEIGLVENQASADNGTFFTVVTNSANAFEIRRMTPALGEAGFYIFYYNAVSGAATPLAANRMRIVRFKKTQSGVASLIGLQSVYSNNDTGWNTVDFTVAASGGDIVITVAGIAATEIRHTIQVIRVAGTLNDSFSLAAR